MTAAKPPLMTPDQRYVVVRGRLWRAADPRLADDARQRLVDDLMDARRAVKSATRKADATALAAARRDVDACKHALGERGPVWWSDGTRDYTRTLARNTPYADWYADQDTSD